MGRGVKEKFESTMKSSHNRSNKYFSTGQVSVNLAKSISTELISLYYLYQWKMKLFVESRLERFVSRSKEFLATFFFLQVTQDV